MYSATAIIRFQASHPYFTLTHYLTREAGNVVYLKKKAIVTMVPQHLLW